MPGKETAVLKKACEVGVEQALPLNSSSAQSDASTPCDSQPALDEATPHSRDDNSSSDYNSISDSSSCSDSNTETNVIESPDKPTANLKVKKKVGRRTKAENLALNPDNSPSVVKYLQPSKGKKRSAGRLLKHPSTVKRSRGNKATPQQAVRSSPFCPIQLFQPRPRVECPELTPSTTADADSEDMEQVLEAIKRIDDKLDNISDELKKVSEDSGELKSLYNTLEKQLQDNDKKHEEKFDRMNERMLALEENYKLHPSSLNAEELRLEIKNQIGAQVSELVASNHGIPIVKTSDELAAKMNRVLEKLDSKERRLRKLNVVVKGLPPEILGSTQQIKEFLATKFDSNMVYTDIKTSSQPPIATVSVPDWDSKQIMLKNKRKALAGTNIYVDPDFTPREQEIGRNLRAIAKEKKSDGVKVKVTPLRLQIEDSWFGWDEFNNCLIPVQVRPYQQGNKNNKSSNNLPGHINTRNKSN